MKYMEYRVLPMAFVATLILGGCGSGKGNPAMGAPPPAQVEREQDLNVIQVDHPEQFPVAAAIEHDAASQLSVTGAVTPDIDRTVPVISLASGRVVDIRARLGDTVKKGQLLMRVESTDVSGAFSDYRKAQADETLARAQLDRSKLLYDKGAIAAKDLEVAQDTYDKARVDVETAMDHLKVLGVDIAHPATAVDIFAPISGVIVEQNVTAAAGVKTLDNSPNLFTI